MAQQLVYKFICTNKNIFLHLKLFIYLAYLNYTFWQITTLKITKHENV